MSAPRSVLGHASVAEAVLALNVSGLTKAEITDPDVVARLRALARRHGTTVSQVTRELVFAAVEHGVASALVEGRF